MAKITGNEFLIKALREEGVEKIFAYPGACVVDITDASIRSKEVMFIKIKGITEKDRAEVFQMAAAFKFQIKDMDKSSVLIEAVRTEPRNDSILKVINERFKNIEVVRGAPVAIESISMQDR